MAGVLPWDSQTLPTTGLVSALRRYREERSRVLFAKTKGYALQRNPVTLERVMGIEPRHQLGKLRFYH